MLGYNKTDRNTWNGIINQIMIWYKYGTGPCHTGKISYQNATSDSLRRTNL